MKKIRFIIALTLTLICMLGSAMSAHAYSSYSSSSTIKRTCATAGCKRNAPEGGSYCGNHKCHVDGCYSKYQEGSIFCSYHQSSSTKARYGTNGMYYAVGYNPGAAKKNTSTSSYSSSGSKYSSSSSSKKSSSTSTKYTSSSSKKKTYHDTYDDGYDDIYFDGDYDDDRYRRDPDYARGVDDAMDDEGWDW